MLCRQKPGFDSFCDGLSNRSSLQVVVDVVVAEPEIRFIGLSGILVEEIGGRRLEVEAFRRAEFDEQGTPLTLGEAGERQKPDGLRHRTW